jgi:hypothetical protein
MFHSGNLLVMPTNIRLGWKSTQVANTLAYYEKAIITAVKSFIVQTLSLLLQTYLAKLFYKLYKKSNSVLILIIFFTDCYQVLSTRRRLVDATKRHDAQSQTECRRLCDDAEFNCIAFSFGSVCLLLSN